jgi:DNA polymerase I-like protein with 3'-5' exonuclease and polymerase domains
MHAHYPEFVCHVCQQVHDDVLLEVPQHAWPGLQAVVASTMEQALPQYGLSLQADVAAGNTWMDCK